MIDYIESKVGDGGKILIEVKSTKSHVGFGPAGADEANKKLDNAFNHALNTIRMASSSVLETLNTLEQKPNQVKIDFAIKIDPNVGAMLARADSSDSQLRVSLGWHTPPENGKSEEEDKEEEDKTEDATPAAEDKTEKADEE